VVVSLAPQFSTIGSAADWIKTQNPIVAVAMLFGAVVLAGLAVGSVAAWLSDRHTDLDGLSRKAWQRRWW
jgi:hypothetical protein